MIDHLAYWPILVHLPAPDSKKSMISGHQTADAVYPQLNSQLCTFNNPI
jgi:hypothetical protein